jgi:hypothetical protein
VKHSQMKQKLAALTAAAGVVAMQAHAELPASAATAVADTIEDVLAGGALMIGLTLAFLGIRKVIAIFSR